MAPKSLGDLPNELLVPIVSHLSDLDSRHEDLRSLALVSHRCHSIATPEIYRFFNQTNLGKHFLPFVISIAKNPRLAKLVKKIAFVGLESITRKLSCEDFKILLQAMGSYACQICVQDWSSELQIASDVALLALLIAMSRQNLQSLEMPYLDTYSKPRSHLHFHVAQKSCHAESLSSLSSLERVQINSWKYPLLNLTSSFLSLPTLRSARIAGRFPPDTLTPNYIFDGWTTTSMALCDEDHHSQLHFERTSTAPEGLRSFSYCCSRTSEKERVQKIVLSLPERAPSLEHLRLVKICAKGHLLPPTFSFACLPRLRLLAISAHILLGPAESEGSARSLASIFSPTIPTLEALSLYEMTDDSETFLINSRHKLLKKTAAPTLRYIEGLEERET
jgi:hypothetical protein